MTSVSLVDRKADIGPDQGLSIETADKDQSDIGISHVASYDKKALQDGANQGVVYGLKVEGRIADLESLDGTYEHQVSCDENGIPVVVGRPGGGVRGEIREFSGLRGVVCSRFWRNCRGPCWVRCGLLP